MKKTYDRNDLRNYDEVMYFNFIARQLSDGYLQGDERYERSFDISDFRKRAIERKAKREMPKKVFKLVCCLWFNDKFYNEMKTKGNSPKRYMQRTFTYKAYGAYHALQKLAYYQGITDGKVNSMGKWRVYFKNRQFRTPAYMYEVGGINE